VPVVIVKQDAAYVDPNEPEAPAEDPRSFAAFYLQGGINECVAGAKPPGMLYFVNLHPYARLSAAINLADDRGNRVGVVSADLAPLSASRAGCSNGSSKPVSVTNAALEAATSDAPSRETQPGEAMPLPAPLALGTILQTQNVCAGSLPPGWIKINDAWNPTVCGNPARVDFNVWTIQRFSDQPKGAIIYACSAAVPSGWAIIGTAWNPTVCGHPNSKQSNVMAIKRLDD
jgi:hypothetical protein